MVVISLAPAKRWFDRAHHERDQGNFASLFAGPIKIKTGRLKSEIPERIESAMSVYWKTMKRGQNLIIDDTSGLEEVIGGFRENKSGINAYARTMGYEPDRSRSDFASVEDAKAFVESFAPWDLFGARDVTVETEVRPIAE